MHPELFHLGPVTIYTYGLMMAIGFLVCYYVLSQELKKRQENPDLASNIVFWAAIGGIAGAKILFIIDYWSEFLADPIGMIFTGSGLVFHGGLIGGTVAVILVLKHYQKPIGPYADLIAPLLLLGQGFGRIGCFFAGCCHGTACELPWAMTFPYASPPADYPVHPTQLYESFYNFIMYFVIVKLVRPKLKIAWQTFAIYLLVAGTERFLIEFIRVNPRVLLGLTSAQLTSLAMVLSGIIIMIITRKTQRLKT